MIEFYKTLYIYVCVYIHLTNTFSIFHIKEKPAFSKNWKF